MKPKLKTPISKNATDVLVVGHNKYTVEELSGDEFISTFWDSETEFEIDRTVTVFETYSAALAHMYREALLHNCTLDMEEL